MRVMQLVLFMFSCLSFLVFRHGARRYADQRSAKLRLPPVELEERLEAS